MADTRITDVVVPAIFSKYMLKRTVENSLIFTSGLVRRDAEIQRQLNAGGKFLNVPFWNDLAGDATVGTDNPASSITPDKLSTGKDISVRENWTKAWSNMDLASILAGDNAPTRVLERVSAWWERWLNKVLSGIIEGVVADNIAADSGDMVNDIYSDIVTPAADNKISRTAVNKALKTAGDAREMFGIMLCHSDVYSDMLENNDISFIKESDNSLTIQLAYGKFRPIVTDTMPKIAGSNSPAYISAFAVPGVFGFGEASQNVIPTEVQRKPDAGDGMGQEILYTRRSLTIHPYGIAFQAGGMSGDSPTLAELKLAAAWSRVYTERKQVGLAFLKSNASV
jgi:hypothetical protein